MNLWERFLRTIYRIAALPFLKRYQAKSIESVLRKSTKIIDSDIQVEIRNHILKSFTKDGGFADRSGKPDIYYSLFGYFVAEALSIDEVFPQLRDYVQRVVSKEPLSGIHLYCGAILYSRLHGFDSTTERLRLKVEAEVEAEAEKTQIGSEYNSFIGLLTLYYLQDYRYILKLKKRIKKLSNQKDIPCSMAAAEAVINRVMEKTTTETETKLLSFYRGKGGFVALQKSPVEDLLSTAVALYALHTIDTDIKEIKPDCFSFVDGLYLNGGFRATELDFDVDIEYTFYGLLALGALSK